MKRAGLAVAFGISLVALVSCSDEQPLTQIVVVVDSDMTDLARIEIEVRGFGDPFTVDADLEEQRLPRRLTLLHDGGALGPIDVIASGYRAQSDTPALVESRTGIDFVQDATRMLRIELLQECIGVCAPEACLEGPRCEAPRDAWTLEPWPGHTTALDPAAGGAAPTADGGAAPKNDGGDASDAAPMPDATSAVRDASTDAGSMASPFPYAPSNFDPTRPALGTADTEVVLDCGGEAIFDSENLRFTDWCGGEPSVAEFDQPSGIPLVALVMSRLEVAAGDTLRLVGDRPVALVILGDATIDGSVDASARASTPGPGADLGCSPAATNLGGPGGDGRNAAAGGGGGGGFGGPGGAGGLGADAATGIAGGSVAGSAALSPLRGGCSGGSGGSHDGSSILGAGGGGGGGVQISVAGRLDLTGTVAATGGGGGVGSEASDGGGGGGSGGAILLEGAPVSLSSSARLLASGGGGGAGESGQSPGSSEGEDGSVAGIAPAAGGSDNGVSSAGDGGAGSAPGADAAPGENGRAILSNAPGGGGGGGGGAGRIRVNGVESCSGPASASPAPSLRCPGCDSQCPMPPAASCAPNVLAGRTYFACGSALAWEEARDACAASGLELAAPQDSGENDFVAGLLADPAWLGGNDRTLEGAWEWTAGDAFWSGDSTGGAQGGAFTNWASSQPSASTTDSDCLEIETDGSWDDIACDSDRPYVCAP